MGATAAQAEGPVPAVGVRRDVVAAAAADQARGHAAAARAVAAEDAVGVELEKGAEPRQLQGGLHFRQVPLRVGDDDLHIVPAQKKKQLLDGRRQVRNAQIDQDK